MKLPGADGTAAVTRQRSFPGLLAVGRGCKFQAGGCADGQVKERSPLDVTNQATQLPMSIRGLEGGLGEGEGGEREEGWDGYDGEGQMGVMKIAGAA